MLRRLVNGEIALGFLVATIFWIAVLGWATSFAPTNPEKEACYQAAARSGHSTEECKTFWEKTTSDPIAMFTLVLAFSTVGLWVATIGLYFAGEKAITETRRIGEAQVRAYVHIKSAGVDFIRFGQLQPRVGFIAANSGQSPARNFIWNVTLQYAATSINKQSPPFPDWLNGIGYDIAANSDAPQEIVMIPNMTVEQSIPPGTTRTIVRFKIKYRFTDVFDKDWLGETYFAGIMYMVPTATAEGIPTGSVGWQARVSQLPKPRDWEEIGRSPV